MPMDGPVNRHSSPAAKIAFFRSLFRGREDIYPRRFESRKTGKSGYQGAEAMVGRGVLGAGESIGGVVRFAGEEVGRSYGPVRTAAAEFPAAGRSMVGRVASNDVLARSERVSAPLQDSWWTSSTAQLGYLRGGSPDPPRYEAALARSKTQLARRVRRPAAKAA